jgi:hypothetical protein
MLGIHAQRFIGILLALLAVGRRPRTPENPVRPVVAQMRARSLKRPQTVYKNEPNLYCPFHSIRYLRRGHACGVFRP